MSKRLIIFLAMLCTALVLLVLSFSNGFIFEDFIGEQFNQDSPYRKVDLRVKIIPAPKNTYGYNIIMNERILIHQPNIPSSPGNEGFNSEEDAQKVAEHVMTKLRNNIFPPSISPKELDSLRIVY